MLALATDHDLQRQDLPEDWVFHISRGMGWSHVLPSVQEWQCIELRRTSEQRIFQGVRLRPCYLLLLLTYLLDTSTCADLPLIPACQKLAIFDPAPRPQMVLRGLEIKQA
jgi:hypothetical protein